MNVKRFAVIAALLAGLGAAPMLYPVPAEASGATALQPKEGWYKELVGFDFVRANVEIPLKKGVTIIDSRPGARQYDPGHIPGAINIPDSQFDKLAGQIEKTLDIAFEDMQMWLSSAAEDGGAVTSKNVGARSPGAASTPARMRSSSATGTDSPSTAMRSSNVVTCGEV